MYVQYLITAMLTGAVQVIAFISFSRRSLELQGNCSDVTKDSIYITTEKARSFSNSINNKIYITIY